jgi:hypothetical protein
MRILIFALVILVVNEAYGSKHGSHGHHTKNEGQESKHCYLGQKLDNPLGQKLDNSLGQGLNDSLGQKLDNPLGQKLDNSPGQGLRNSLDKPTSLVDAESTTTVAPKPGNFNLIYYIEFNFSRYKLSKDNSILCRNYSISNNSFERKLIRCPI